jgi:pectate lyase
LAVVYRLFLAAAALLAVTTAVACGDARFFVYDKPDEPIGPSSDCPNSLIGYAAVAGTDADGGVSQATNGGNDSTTPPVTIKATDVGAVDNLTAELQRPEPRIIFLDGVLSPMATIKVTIDKTARGGNKTLIGVGASSGLTGAGLDLSYADNVIVRNLKISKVSIGEGDAITLLASQHIWVDHCDLSSERDNPNAGYDGLVDITHGSSYVTVSWTLFHDHKDTSLVGHTLDTAQKAEDSALTVTYHHNAWFNVGSGPRVRWGTAHVAFNHFQNVSTFGIVSEADALVFVENNMFDDDVTLPVTTNYLDDPFGTMVEKGDRFPPGFPLDITRPTTTPPPLPYSYMPDSADGSAPLVSKCAGTGKIAFN